MLDLTSAILELKREFPWAQVRQNEPMREHTSFRIGGPVSAMFLPCSGEETACVCRILAERGTVPLVIGNGTNLLVSDEPLDIAVIKLGEGLSSIRLTGEDEITADSGAQLSRIAVFAQEHGLTGFEFAHGIPGTLGGAVAMNAGAYGGEIKDVLRLAEAMDVNGRMAVYPAEENRLAYRRSRYTDSGEIVLRAVLQLHPGEPGEIRARMEELRIRRRASQPLNLPSAGSTFKRPAAGYAAALIDETGLKGRGVGGARVSEKHAGFIVNMGGATFDDVLRTIELVQSEVFARKGIWLEPEVKIVR